MGGAARVPGWPASPPVGPVGEDWGGAWALRGWAGVERAVRVCSSSTSVTPSRPATASVPPSGLKARAGAPASTPVSGWTVTMPVLTRRGARSHSSTRPVTPDTAALDRSGDSATFLSLTSNSTRPPRRTTVRLPRLIAYTASPAGA